MKKSTLIACLLIIMACASGCGQLVDMPQIDDEQTKLITEYAAGLILQNEDTIKSNLLSDEELAAEAEKEAQQREKERQIRENAAKYLENVMNSKEEQNSDSDSQTNNDVSGGLPQDAVVDNLASFYGFEGFDVNYTGYELTDSYPSSGEDMLMAMEATPGKQLCVLKFNVTNNLADNNSFDMFYKSPNFYLEVEGAKRIHYQSTLLLDDLAAYTGDFAGNETKEMVLVFEIDENIDSVGAMGLYMKTQDAKGTMSLQ